MKYNFKYLIALLISIGITSCSNDDVRVADGDPLQGNVVTVNATLSATDFNTAEDVNFAYTATIDQSFATEATLTVRVRLDNGNFANGTVVFAAGETTKSASIAMPADDEFISVNRIELNAGTIEAIALILDEGDGNTYDVESNVLDLNIYADAAAADGGLNIVLDWESADVHNLDLIVRDASGALEEFSVSSTRFDNVLVGNAGRVDGVYLVIIRRQTSTTDDVNFDLLFTDPDGNLTVLNDDFSSANGNGQQVVVATYTRVTDLVTGVVSYVDIEL